MMRSSSAETVKCHHTNQRVMYTFFESLGIKLNPGVKEDPSIDKRLAQLMTKEATLQSGRARDSVCLSNVINIPHSKSINLHTRGTI